MSNEHDTPKEYTVDLSPGETDLRVREAGISWLAANGVNSWSVVMASVVTVQGDRIFYVGWQGGDHFRLRRRTEFGSSVKQAFCVPLVKHAREFGL